MDMALKIYQAAKNNSSIDLHVIMTLLNVLEKSNQIHMKIDSVFNDLLIKLQKMEPSDIAKAKTANWGSILKILCMGSRESDVITLTDIIQKNDIMIDNRLYTFALKTCIDKGWTKLGKHIHTFIEQNGKMNLILKNCLINMYGKYGYLDETIKIFNSIKVSERNIIIGTTMISIYAEHGKRKEVPELLWEMQNEGIIPSNKSITCILKAFCTLDQIENAAEILFSMEKKLGIKPDEYHYNCLLTACAEMYCFH
jgi:pentatricopeptide repeat protein